MGNYTDMDRTQNFYWWVNSKGYEMRETDEGDVLCSHPDNERSRPNPSKQYQPLKKPGLYRRFANLPENPQAIIDFANTYGLLGVSASYPFNEAVEIWHSEIQKMASAIRLHENILNGNLQEFCAEFAEFDNLDSDDWHRFAVEWLTTTINEALSEKASPYLMLPQVDRKIVYPVGLAFRPNNFLAALWIQFALDVAGMKKRLICRACGNMFWLKYKINKNGDRQIQRADSLYCSHKCKMAEYRRRRKTKAPEEQTSAG
ncbi:MAG: hypothetical protein ABFD49_11860 [Armatimonadota bacterium]|nr:hypothetical protein [bacterium]